MDWTARINPQLHLCWSGAWRRGFIEPPRILADHELVLVERGGCRVDIAGRASDLAPGGWVVVPPGVDHRSLALGDGCLRHCLHFDWDWLGPPGDGPWFAFAQGAARLAPRAAPDWVPSGILRGSATPDAIATAGRVGVRWRAGDRAGARGLMLCLLLDLLAPRRQASAADRSAALAWQVKERLDRGELAGRSLREELRRLGHSYEHLCRCFTRTFGMPPLRYLILVRIETAKLRLLAQRVRFEEVAAELGYGDPEHFSRVFRRIVGLAPMAWRRRELAADPTDPARVVDGWSCTSMPPRASSRQPDAG